jgi:general L-amino acid transport system permease protein
MAMDSEAPKDAFRLSMLLYDTRYRSLTIQVFALFLLMLGAAWLVDNTIQNLAALGKDFSFSFLGNVSGYDINQRLIEYSSTSTHARAAVVGLLNTLVLAVASCVAATIIGVLAGILRLSNNWMVGKLMTIYIETFRNIPTLLWIVVFGAIVTESFPAPTAFRGAEPTATMKLFDSVAITNRGVHLPSAQFERSLGSIDLGSVSLSVNALAIIAVIIASIWGFRRLNTNAMRVQNATGVRPTTWWKGLLILFVPVIALLLALGFYLDYPILGRFNFSGGGFVRSSFIAMWLGLSIYTGAFIAENVRAGILAVSGGQSEAAFALGIQPGLTMRLVVLPQALRVIVPPLISQYLNITKNTSLGLAVGYMDLRSTLGGITINQTGRELEGMGLMMLIYLALSLLISSIMNYYNSRVKLKGR